MKDFISILLSAVLQLIVLTLIPFIWWLITDRKTNFFRWIGLKLPKWTGSKLKVFLFIIGAAGIYILGMYLIMTNLMGDTETGTNQFAGKGVKAIPSILVYAIIQTSLSEEIFFRGFLCKRLTNRFGFVKGNLTQALLFGLMHGIPFGIATGNILVTILLIILPAAIGYLQGWLNEKQASGSILPSWILHAIMNFFSALSVI